MHRGSTRHFSGIFMRVSGKHEGISDMLNQLDYVSGAEVIGYTNTGDKGTEELTIQAHAFARPKHLSMARARGLDTR